jgi:hypothetical protein
MECRCGWYGCGCVCLRDSEEGWVWFTQFDLSQGNCGRVIQRVAGLDEQYGLKVWAVSGVFRLGNVLGVILCANGKEQTLPETGCGIDTDGAQSEVLDWRGNNGPKGDRDGQRLRLC